MPQVVRQPGLRQVSALLALWPFWLAGTWIATVSGMCLGIYCVDRRKKESA